MVGKRWICVPLSIQVVKPVRTFKSFELKCVCKLLLTVYLYGPKY